MTLLSFAVMILVGAEGDEQIEHYAGLARRSPLLAVALLVSMISLAGIPFTVGFLGKFFIFDAAIRQHQTLLVVIGVITVGCGFYYYLKVVRAMFWLEPPHDLPPLQVSALSRTAIALLIAGIFVLGVYPQPVLNALQPKRRGDRDSLGYRRAGLAAQDRSAGPLLSSLQRLRGRERICFRMACARPTSRATAAIFQRGVGAGILSALRISHPITIMPDTSAGC